MRIGYRVGSGEGSVGADLFQDTSHLERSQTLYEAAEIIAHNKLIIASTKGDLEVISSKMKFTKAKINVRGMHFHTHQEIHQESITTTNMSVGINVGIKENLSSAINTDVVPLIFFLHLTYIINIFYYYCHTPIV